MKIAICGKIASGKTTLANKLCEAYGFQKFSFAAKVKEVATEICGMHPDKKDRRLLQTIGHGLRQIISSDVWITPVLSQTKNIKRAVIDDLRYANELAALKQNGWIVIRLNISDRLQEERIRAAYPNSHKQHIENLMHPSETELDEVNIKAFDFSIDVDDPGAFDSFLKNDFVSV